VGPAPAAVPARRVEPDSTCWCLFPFFDNSQTRSDMHPNTTFLTKTVNTHMAGQGRTLQVEVDRDTTIRQMLQRLGLVPDECDVASPTGDRLLGLNDRPWDVVQGPHDGIVVSPQASVG